MYGPKPAGKLLARCQLIRPWPRLCPSFGMPPSCSPSSAAGKQLAEEAHEDERKEMPLDQMFA